MQLSASPLTKDEFLTRQKAAKREESRVSIVWLIFFFGVLFANLPLSKWVDHHKHTRWIPITHGILFFGFLIGNLFLMNWIGKRRARKFGLLCPSCNKLLTAFTGQIVVATGKCGHCGQAILNNQ